MEQEYNKTDFNLETLESQTTLAWDIRFADPKRSFQIATSLLSTIEKNLPQSNFHNNPLYPRLLLTLAYCRIRFSDFTDSFELALKAEKLFQSTKDERGVIWAHILMSTSEEKKGKYEEALTRIESALQNAIDIKFDEGVGNLIYRKAYVYYSKGDYKVAYQFFSESHQIFLQHDVDYGVAYAETGLGNVAFHKGDYTNALKHYNRASELFFNVQELSGQANAINNIGFIHLNLGDYAGANEFLHQALALRKSCDDINGEALSLHGIGIVQNALGNHKEALEFFKKALILRRNTGDTRGEAESLHAIGSQYFHLNDLENALSFLNKGLEIQDRIGDLWGRASSLAEIGGVYEKAGNIQEAIRFYEESLKLREMMEDRIVAASCCRLLAGSLSKVGRFDEALSFAQKALSIAESLKARAEIYHSHFVLSEVFERMLNISLAFHHYKLFQKIKEEVFSEESTKRLKSIEVLYQLEQARKEAELRKAEADIYRLKNSEMSAMNEALSSANAMKTKLLGVAASDLKYPLGSIANFAKLLLERKDGRSNQDRQYLNIIVDLSNRMVTLLNDLLSNAALETGQISVKKRPINFGQLVQVLSITYQEWAKRKEQSLTLNIDETCMVFGDEERLREVVNNLVLNAVKFTERGKSIDISVLRVQSFQSQPILDHTLLANDDLHQTQFAVRLSVRDEGQGILEDEFALLFQRFSKLTSSPTEGENSTGLGLSIVKELVELHNGKVWVESPGRNQGTTVNVELPLLERNV
ncbi:MAG: tetratricopeptide repeat protein [Chloroherpetonaceae bacterium]|nr:tetratricopeptide repeat protein [Chloroherpetonaceae bacterium]